MSVINQMLRDLDRQQAQPLRLEGQALPVVPEAGGSWGWKLAALGFLAGGIALAVWLRPAPPAQVTARPAAAAVAQPKAAEPAPAAMPAPPKPSPAASAPEPVPAAEIAAPVPPAAAPVPAEALEARPEPEPPIETAAAPEPEPEPQAEPEATAQAAPQWHKSAAPAPAPDPAAQAIVLLQAGRAAEAEALLMPALAARPEAAGLRLLLARARMAQGRNAQALALLSEREAPGERDYQTVMAALEQQQGLHGAALRRYTELSRRHPEDASLWLGLGLALDGLSRRAEARAAYARALQLNSLSEPARAHAAARLAAGD